MNDICEILKNITNKIYISGHKNPDLDSLCTSLALGLILNTLGKNAKVLIDDKNYEELLYFNCSNFIINKIDNNDEDYTFIAVDLNKKERLPNSVIDIYEKSNYKINIDHHIGNTTNADYICSIEDISSTCEIVYNIAKLCNIKIDKKISELLFTGIMSDTNLLTINATYETYSIMSDLIKNKINKEFLLNKYILSKSEDEMKIISYMINNLKNNSFHYIVLDMNLDLFKNVEYVNIKKNVFHL